MIVICEPGPCPKCGGEEVGFSYHAQRCDKPGCSCSECSYGSYAKQHTEHLHAVCSRCRFDWVFPVAAESGEPPAPPEGEAAE